MAQRKKKPDDTTGKITPRDKTPKKRADHKKPFEPLSCNLPDRMKEMASLFRELEVLMREGITDVPIHFASYGEMAKQFDQEGPFLERVVAEYNHRQGSISDETLQKWIEFEGKKGVPGAAVLLSTVFGMGADLSGDEYAKVFGKKLSEITEKMRAIDAEKAAFIQQVSEGRSKPPRQR